MTNTSMEQSDLELEVDETQEEESLITYDIATYPSDFTLSVIHEMWRGGDITIPPFQRKFVWTVKQSSLLIESFLLGLPIPPVFFYIDGENKNLVIDGQQRISSVIFYFEGFFGYESAQGKKQVFRLQGLNHKSPYYRKQFKELSDSDQRKLRNTVLRAINIRQLSPKNENTSIYHIFERLNTGGTPLRPQEIRSVVFRGEINTILGTLNKDPNWRKLLGKKNIDKHQTDVELVLRAFCLSQSVAEYEKPMKDFLNKILQKNIKGDTPTVRRFERLFPLTAELLVETLGERPFNLRGRLNTSALDAVFCTVMDNITNVPVNLKDRYAALVADPAFEEVTTLGTTDVSVVKRRFELVRKHLLG